jgi:hypothetical protein
MRNGATSMRKSPAHDFVQTRSALAVIASDSACHAGGRGFGSRRSRLLKCLQIGTGPVAKALCDYTK